MIPGLRSLRSLQPRLLSAAAARLVTLAALASPRGWYLSPLRSSLNRPLHGFFGSLPRHVARGQTFISCKPTPEDEIKLVPG
jgi:hypothetical protein